MTAQNAIINCVLAPLALVGLSALGAAIDAAPDAREETANILSQQDAQRAAEMQARVEQSGYEVCKANHGPNVLAAWNFEGQLICQPKRGPAGIVTAQAAIK